MAFLRYSDYYNESKKNKEVTKRRGSHGGVATSKKVTLPTQYRTLSHQCSQCPRKDAKKYKISIKEVRWLCPVCVIKNQNRDIKEKPNFVKASQLIVNQEIK